MHLSTMCCLAISIVPLAARKHGHFRGFGRSHASAANSDSSDPLGLAALEELVFNPAATDQATKASASRGLAALEELLFKDPLNLFPEARPDWTAPGDPHSWGALAMKAARAGNIEELKAALGMPGANVNEGVTRAWDVKTGSYSSWRYGGHIFFEKNRRHGAHHARVHPGDTLLHLVARGSRDPHHDKGRAIPWVNPLEVAKALLELGANPDATNLFGEKPVDIKSIHSKHVLQAAAEAAAADGDDETKDAGEDKNEDEAEEFSADSEDEDEEESDEEEIESKQEEDVASEEHADQEAAATSASL